MEDVVFGARAEHPHAELDRVRFRRGRHLVDERFGGERGLRTVRIAQIARAQRRLPDERQADDVRGDARVGDGVHVRRPDGLPGSGRRAPAAHQLRDENGVRLVVTEMAVVGGAGGVVERDEMALRVEAAAHLYCIRRAFRVPRRFLVAHPLHAHRPADFLRDVRRFESRVAGGRAAESLRSIHPDDADLLARHAEKLRDAVAQSVRLHLVGIDRHLAVRRIGQRVRRRNRGVALERHFVVRLDDFRGRLQRFVGMCRRRSVPSSTSASRRACNRRGPLRSGTARPPASAS